MSNTNREEKTMNTYTYAIISWFDGDSDRKVTYGKGGWEYKQARSARNAALRRTDKIDGLNATGQVICDADVKADRDYRIVEGLAV
jgi:hypothetical protein